MEFSLGQEVVIYDGSVEHGERGKIEGRRTDRLGRVIFDVRVYDDGVLHPAVPAELRPLLKGHGPR